MFLCLCYVLCFLKRRGSQGASVEVLHYGATIISWKAGGLERLFVSSKAILDGSKPVRGGIPVVFPCFGAGIHSEHMKLPQHGFARSEKWTLDGIARDNDFEVSVKFSECPSLIILCTCFEFISFFFLLEALKPSTQIMTKYEPKFEISYTVTLFENQLCTNLTVYNPPDSIKELEFQALLHNYFRVPATSVRITPLQNVGYYDKTRATDEEKAIRRIESRAEVDVQRYTDFVYEDAHGVYILAWPDGKIVIETKNFKDVVIWNPQEEGNKIGDMEEGGW